MTQCSINEFHSEFIFFWNTQIDWNSIALTTVVPQDTGLKRIFCWPTMPNAICSERYWYASNMNVCTLSHTCHLLSYSHSILSNSCVLDSTMASPMCLHSTTSVFTWSIIKHGRMQSTTCVCYNMFYIDDYYNESIIAWFYFLLRP